MSMSAYQVNICFSASADQPPRRAPVNRYADLAEAFDAGIECVEFSSRYGLARVTPVSGLMPVNTMHSDRLDPRHLITIDHAEQLTLITGNRFCLPSVVFPITGQCFAMLYVAGNIACFCALEILRFECATSAQNMLEYLNSAQSAREACTGIVPGPQPT